MCFERKRVRRRLLSFPGCISGQSASKINRFQLKLKKYNKRSFTICSQAGGRSYLLFKIHLGQGRVGQLRNAESPPHGTLFCRR